MASPPEPSCAQTIAQDDPPRQQIPFAKDNQPRSADRRDYDFVKRPSQDFFCPVTLELLLEPQLTSCCGHHLSLETSSRLQREGKACPLCSETGWSTMLDKFHRRRVHELRVRCPLRVSGCDWVGEVNELQYHTDSCAKGAWECRYCGLECTYGEGEGEHWLTCRKFPVPCPNGCEVGSVERCNVERHRSVCPLEPLSCEMSEFGCSAVVPRKDLATHMRESELQHLTGMAVLNLRLTRQLQQDLARLQTEIMKNREDLNGQIHQVQVIAKHIEVHSSRKQCDGCTLDKIFTFGEYSQYKGTNKSVDSDPFYSQQQGYKLRLCIKFYGWPTNQIGAFIYLLSGEFDHQLLWPVRVRVYLELLNQAGDHHHVERIKTWKWGLSKRDNWETIASPLMPYSDLEKRGDGVQYMMNDCLKFRLHIAV